MVRYDAARAAMARGACCSAGAGAGCRSWGAGAGCRSWRTHGALTSSKRSVAFGTIKPWLRSWEKKLSCGPKGQHPWPLPNFPCSCLNPQTSRCAQCVRTGSWNGGCRYVGTSSVLFNKILPMVLMEGSKSNFRQYGQMKSRGGAEE